MAAKSAKNEMGEANSQMAVLHCPGPIPTRALRAQPLHLYFISTGLTSPRSAAMSANRRCRSSRWNLGRRRSDCIPVSLSLEWPNEFFFSAARAAPLAGGFSGSACQVFGVDGLLQSPCRPEFAQSLVFLPLSCCPSSGPSCYYYYYIWPHVLHDKNPLH